jgi:argininosuccinate lyase
LSEDLQIWVTQEFDLVDLADGFCRASVMMPQKKNPYSLAFIRGAAGVLIGHQTAMANVGKTISAQPDNRIFAYSDIPQSLDLGIQVVQLMTGIIKTLSINVSSMARKAEEGHSEATDLAEIIMLQSGIPYMTAHHLVAEVIADITREGLSASQITSRIIDTAAIRLVGHALNIPDAEIGKALQPREIVSTRTGLGGAAAEPVNAMITESRKKIADLRHWLKQTVNHLAEVEAKLILAANNMAGITPSKG